MSSDDLRTEQFKSPGGGTARGPVPPKAERVVVKGTILAGRYQLERLLGEGASGRVYLARDTKERGAVWAVKELSYSGLASGEAQEARSHFRTEAALLQKLRHASLPRIVDFFEAGSNDYLVMERVEGPTLEDLIERRGKRPFDSASVLKYGQGLVDILFYLHGRKPPIIYRDLKPQNVMVTIEGSVKLIDFGIARSLKPGKAGDTTAYGTPGYAPPEQYQQRSLPASDVYALGITLLRAATLYDPPEFSFQHPLATELNPAIHPRLEALLASMVEKKHSRRPSTAEVRLELEAIAQLADQPPIREWWSTQNRRLKKWWKQKR